MRHCVCSPLGLFFFLFRMNRYKDKLRPPRNTILCQLFGSLDARALELVTPHTGSQPSVCSVSCPFVTIFRHLFSSHHSTLAWRQRPFLRTAREKRLRKDWTVQIVALACRLVIRPCIELPSSASGRLYTTADWLPSPPPQPTGATITRSVAHSLTAKSASCRPILRRRPGEHGPW